MKPQIRKGKRAALSRIEVLALVAVAVLAGILVLPLKLKNKTGDRRFCVYNLKNVGLAIRTVAADFNGEYPWRVAVTNGGLGPLTNAVSNDLLGIYAVLSNELSTPRIIQCPLDVRATFRTNTWRNAVANPTDGHRVPSYFLGLDASEEVPESVLAGDRNLNFDGPSELAWLKVTVSTPSWKPGHRTGEQLKSLRWDTNSIHKSGGTLLMGDGSVQQYSSGLLREAVTTAQTASNNRLEWLMPVDH